MPDAEPSHHDVLIEGRRLHYVMWGSGGSPPLLVFHGIGRGASAWDHLAPRLAERFTVYAVDLRGHGSSDWDPEARYLVEDYTADVEVLLDRLELPSCAVWGNSTGGRVAQVLAAVRPEQVTALVAEDVGPERPTSIAHAYQERVSQEPGWPSEQAMLDDLVARSPSTPRERLLHLVQQEARRGPDRRVRWRRDPATAGGFVPTDLWGYVERVRAPALYLVGGLSTIVPSRTQLELARRAPSARVVCVAGAGHFPSDEQPDEVLDLVVDFLDDCWESVGEKPVAPSPPHA